MKGGDRVGAVVDTNNVDLSKTTVGKRIRQARRWIDMTQRQLGQRVGRGQSSISAIESGESSLDLEYIPKMAEATGQSVLFFLGFEPLNENPFKRWRGVNIGARDLLAALV